MHIPSGAKTLKCICPAELNFKSLIPIRVKSKLSIPSGVKTLNYRPSVEMKPSSPVKSKISNNQSPAGTIQLIKNQLHTEKSIFDFLVKIKYQGSQFIKKCQNVKIVYQEIKDWRFGFKIWNFLNLEIFLSIENFFFSLNFKPNFHHVTRWFKESSQHESCSPPQNIQLLFKKFSQKMLVSQVMNFWNKGPWNF